MAHISDIKLIRTDTTLDLSQKAEKGIILNILDLARGANSDVQLVQGKEEQYLKFMVLAVNSAIHKVQGDREMASAVRDILMHPGDIYPLLKMKMVIWNVEKQISSSAQSRLQHWAFCYAMLYRVSRSFALVIYQLHCDELRDAVLVFYLVLRALDTVEDDMDIAADIKIPILRSFHHHIYDIDWKFSCGTAAYKDLMDQFHHVQSAFLELKKSYQEAIEEIVKLMGEGMAKFTINEIETISDLDEYAHYVAGLVGLGLCRLFYASGLEDMAPDNLSNAMGKDHIIKDFLEDINEVPKVRLFWPRQIWSKYVDSLEDLKYEDNSVKALQCLNEMITNALVHAEDCLKYTSYLRDTSIFRLCAIPLVMSIGTLASCYNNIETFRSGVKLKRGLAAKIFDQTRQMSDVYDAFIEYSSILQSKVVMDDPNATETLSRIETILKICRNPRVKQ